jgi:Amidohydrolase family
MKAVFLAVALLCSASGISACSKAPEQSASKTLEQITPKAGQAGRAPRERPAFTVFDNVSVLSMSPGVQEIQTNYRVVVKGNEIHEVGPKDTVSIPAGAQVVDGQGKFLLPGFVDSHVHLAFNTGAGGPPIAPDPAMMSLWLEQGATTIRTYSGIARNLEWRKKVEDDSWLGTRVVVAGAIIVDDKAIREIVGGDPTKLPKEVLDQYHHTGPSNAQEAATTINAQYDQGYEYSKVYSGVNKEIFDSVVNTVKSRNGFLAGHIPAVPLDYALANMNEVAHLIELLQFYKPEEGTLDAFVERYAKIMKEKNVSLVFNWSLDEFGIEASNNDVNKIFERSAYTHIPHDVTDPVKKEMGLIRLLKWLPIIAGDNPTMQQQEYAIKAVAKLIDAGILVVAGTDFGDGGTAPEFIHRELELMVQGGVSPYQALLTATRNGATVIGRIRKKDADFGEVKRGYKADLLLLDANPLVSISNTRKRAGVMVNGRWFTQNELSEMAAAFANMPLISATK